MKIVTAAIIIKDGRYLIAQRGKDEKLAGLWEFPGGKMENDETPEECLIREIQEELNIEIEILEYFGESIYEYATGKIKLVAYIAKKVSGEVNLSVHDQIKWINASEFDHFTFAPADIPLVEKLKGYPEARKEYRYES